METWSIRVRGQETEDRATSSCILPAMRLNPESRIRQLLPPAEERIEERLCGTDCVHAHVTVAAELDVNPFVITDLAERSANRREIHRPLAEHQVLMNIFDHVFDMDVHDARPPLAQERGNVSFSGTMDVSQVDCQLQKRMLEPLVELVEAVEGIDEHAGFWLKGQNHAGLLGVVENRPE